MHQHLHVKLEFDLSLKDFEEARDAIDYYTHNPQELIKALDLEVDWSKVKMEITHIKGD